MRTDVAPALQHEQAALEGGPLDLLGMLGGVELHPDHESLAAHVTDEVRIALLQRPETGHRLDPALGRILDQPALEQVDGGQRRSAGDRIAAVGRAVVPPPTPRGSRHARRGRDGHPRPMPLAVSRMSGSTP